MGERPSVEVVDARTVARPRWVGRSVAMAGENEEEEVEDGPRSVQDARDAAPRPRPPPPRPPCRGVGVGGDRRCEAIL